MASVDKEALQNLFMLRDFHTMFTVIDNEYKNCNLGKYMNDAEKIQEYSWINQQLRKFAGTKKQTLMEKRTYEEMIVQIDDWISNASEYGKDRMNLIYGFLRDQLLIEWRAIIEDMIEEWMYETDEEEE